MRVVKHAEASYEARRAASLAGVPVSTVYYWARRGIWPPAMPNGRPKLWSYSDLLALRLIDWLRRGKADFELPHTKMSEIRTFLASVEDLGEHLSAETVKVWVEKSGRVFVSINESVYQPLGDRHLQPLIDHGMVNLVAAYEGTTGISAPDLVRPRPTLRIIPGKLSSEPHVNGTRLGTQMIDALHRRGIGRSQIIDLYSFLTPLNVDEAISLEEQLERSAAA
jgi:DNA-binding transcriptional MerR regulator/uncharacterized protein (DUF433 family)